MHPLRCSLVNCSLGFEMIVCLDGPAGSGKSTISKIVAERTGMVHLDTGAFYRSLALSAKQLACSWNDESGLVKVADTLKITFKTQAKQNLVLVNDVDVSVAIRTPEMGNGASAVSKHKAVRAKLVKLQQEFAKNNSLVCEGRDAGTVIFPDAELKIYLDASLEERARRRFKDFDESGNRQKLEDVMHDIEKRDFDDSNREASPLKKAADARILDTTNLTPEQVVNTIIEWIEEYAS